MKTKTIKTVQQKACGAVLSSLALVGTLTLATSVNAATVPFFDDFEDGNFTANPAWTPKPNPIPAGPSFANVVYVASPDGTDSQMAHIYQSGTGELSLSQVFNYDANYLLSFDMRALSTVLQPQNIGVPDLYSESGVRLSFLDGSSGVLGTYTISNNSDPSVVDSGGVTMHYIDDINATLTHYSGTFGSYAAMTGATGIASLKLEFFATGNSSGIGDSTAQVWFDNVAVPVPAAVWLFGSGLIGLIGVARRNKA